MRIIYRDHLINRTQGKRTLMAQNDVNNRNLKQKFSEIKSKVQSVKNNRQKDNARKIQAYVDSDHYRDFLSTLKYKPEFYKIMQ